MRPLEKAFVLKATAFHAPNWGEVEVLEDALLQVDEEGVISKVCRPTDPAYEEIVRQARAEGNYRELPADTYLLPGFVDVHIHAPQWQNMGKALHVPLEVWLEKYTFPLESSLQELEIAKQVYRDIVEITLRHGTTTAVYLGTQDKESSLCLGRVCDEVGQRGCIGKVAMDNPEQCPDFYRDRSAEEAIASTEEFILELQALAAASRVGPVPVITPRFTPSCTDKTLQGLGDLAAKYRLPVQTHIAESDWEAGYAHDRFGKSDAEVLADFGLLTERSILAHGTQLSDSDALLLAKHHSTVAHCPISNAFFGNAVYPVRRRFDQGVNAGLGTDVSGGFSPSMYDNIRQAVIVSRMLEDGVNAELPKEKRGVADSRIDYRHAFYMATTAGGNALGLPVGLFREGYAFDAQAIAVNEPNSAIRIDGTDTPEDVLQKILFLANSADIQEVWAQGTAVLQKLRRKYGK